MNQETVIDPAIMEDTPRDYLFDNLKAILIILVVWGHILTSKLDQTDVIKSIYVFIFFFHMPAMVFVSGYFSKNLEKIRMNAFTNFFIPYLIFNVISFVYNLLVLKETYGGFLVFSPRWGLWYLFVLFFWRFFLKDMVKIRFLLPLSFIFAILSGFSNEFSEYMELGRMVCFLPFFLLGYYCDKEHIAKIRRMPKMISLIIITASAILSFYLVMNGISKVENLYLRSPYLEGAEIESMLSRIVVYVVAILMTLAIINLTTAKKILLSMIGTSTMTVYILHLYTIPILEKFAILRERPYFYILYSIIITAAIVYLFTRPVVKRAYDTFMDKLTALIIKTNEN